MTLQINDLVKVWEALYDARSKAYNIGLKLEVPVGTLDSIIKHYSDPSDQLRETLKAWLKMPTQQKWQTIVEMLRSRVICEPKLASDIEAEYCPDTPGQANEQPRYTHEVIQHVQQQVQGSQESQRQIQQQLQANDQQVERLQENQHQMQQQVRDSQESQWKVQQQLMQLKLQLQASTQTQETTERLQRKLQEQQHAIEAMQTQQELKQLQSIKQPAAQPQPVPLQQEMTLRKLIWWDGPKVPEAMWRGSVATDDTVVYCNGLDSTRVYQYHSDSQQWSTLPNLPHRWSTLVMANSKLTSVGGYDLFSGITDSLLSLTGEGRDTKWLQHFPPMATKRYATAAICHGYSLIVAGGYDGHNELVTVEVLNIDTQLWSISSSLPHPFTWATTSICGEKLYLLGGTDHTSNGTRSVVTCSISKLLHSCQSPCQSTIWQRVADAPYKASSCATLYGWLVVVGGYDEADKATTAVSAYDESTNSWLTMEAMKTSRYRALVACVHDNTMMVIGGMVIGGLRLDTVEIMKVS